MKIVCLTLLLANVLFFGWSHWIAPSNTPAAVVPTESLPKLVLASEAAGASASTASESGHRAAVTDSQSVEQQTGANGTKCSSVGPFQELSAATQIATALRDKGYEPRTRVVEGDPRAGVWVHLENLPTRAEIQRAMTVLKQQGIADAYLMPSTGRTSEISLGIFSELARAQRRADEVRALGFRPTVTDRRKGTAHWLDVDLKPTDDPIDPADFQVRSEDNSGQIIRVGIQPCPQPAAD